MGVSGGQWGRPVAAVSGMNGGQWRSMGPVVVVGQAVGGEPPRGRGGAVGPPGC